MKYNELVEKVKKLSSKYDFKTVENPLVGQKLIISYGDINVLRVYNYQLYHVEVIAEKFNKLPFSHKLWMLVNEYAMTPINKRFEENKYVVIIGSNPQDSYGYVVWVKTTEGIFVQAYATDTDLYYADSQFTPSEYQDLIEFIKTLPDGEFQAKVAEHGKTLVKKGEE